MSSWQQYVGVFLLAVVTSVASDNYKELTGNQVWKLNQEDEATVQQLVVDGLVDPLDHSGPSTSLRVTPETAGLVKEVLDQAGITYQVIVQDLARYLRVNDVIQRSQVRKELRAQTCTSSSCTAPLTDNYMTFDQMEYYLAQLNSHPRVSVSSIGKSIEGRDIWIVHINRSGCEGQEPIGMTPRFAYSAMKRRTVWLEGGIHAREWISPAVTLQIIHNITHDCSMGRGLEVYVVPMANPDGYVHTWTNNRLWRKNRRNNPDSSCDGVDLNRNWDFDYGVGASPHPCGETYRGTSAFSEPETQALREAMLQVNSTGTLQMVMAVHSYGQLLLYPYGGPASNPAPYKEKMENLGKLFVNTVNKVHDKTYKIMNANELYPASGTSQDWAKGILKAKYAYTLELRSKKTFVLKPDEILPTGQEVLEGLKMVFLALAREKNTQ
ncbi:carboxypeptidase B-like isoform X2 [Homarus americanus]|uniref:Carboxypeptidase A1-like n=2 Tax=Homarus americanus TaxID=6706 RepID=A0A8J5N4E2_HOMAM|nr:carboxypeptidase B-like isoform X2 [Homarus americanus]XP_042214440.1 carboxypeptidase B-like isoform X2 [Homarus americanus]XP_042214442.1 carboxypeptidase B-like isoform X2 [Homarus americanus]KAG7173136.1 Carboxypeptidase A1-like [Homarus americanus]